MIQSKIEQRKDLAMTVARALGRPIWAGDIAQTPLEQEAIRPALHALVKDGQLRKERVRGSAKVFYSLILPPHC